MLFSLATIPAIVLLFYIYKKDKKEKEPMSMLIKLFIFGIISVIPILIVETILDLGVEILTTPGSVAYALLDGFIVAALSEEFFKRFFLKSGSFKNPNFNCMFDGVVYAVFVSMGFAIFENVLYVMDGGIGVAIMRMLTSLPGHATFGVYMGYYYSKAKMYQVRGDVSNMKKNLKLSLIVPILIHGFYDFLLMMDESAVGAGLSTLAYITWFAFIIVLYIFTFTFVNKASREDFFIAPKM